MELGRFPSRNRIANAKLDPAACAAGNHRCTPMGRPHDLPQIIRDARLRFYSNTQATVPS
jgi:hypothetical protein